MDRVTRFAIAPRLLMLGALFFCVFGFVVHDAAESTAASHSHTAVVGAATAGEHADHGETVGAVQLAPASAPVHTPVSHTGHGGAGEHSFNCMPSASAGPVAVAPDPGTAAVASAMELAGPAPAPFVAPVAAPRPPDLRSLCVQRV